MHGMPPLRVSDEAFRPQPSGYDAEGRGMLCHAPSDAERRQPARCLGRSFLRSRGGQEFLPIGSFQQVPM